MHTNKSEINNSDCLPLACVASADPRPEGGKSGTEVVVDVTAEVARVTEAEQRRTPENTMDFNQELDTIVEGVH
jgi:hypothetical protein